MSDAKYSKPARPFERMRRNGDGERESRIVLPNSTIVWYNSTI